MSQSEGLQLRFEAGPQLGLPWSREALVFITWFCGRISETRNGKQCASKETDFPFTLQIQRNITVLTIFLLFLEREKFCFFCGHIDKMKHFKAWTKFYVEFKRKSIQCIVRFQTEICVEFSPMKMTSWNYPHMQTNIYFCLLSNFLLLKLKLMFR